MKHVRCLLFLLIGVTSVMSTAADEEPIGFVFRVSGQVMHEINGVQAPLEEEDPIYVGSVLSESGEGRASVQLLTATRPRVFTRFPIDGFGDEGLDEIPESLHSRYLTTIGGTAVRGRSIGSEGTDLESGFPVPEVLLAYNLPSWLRREDLIDGGVSFQVRSSGATAPEADWTFDLRPGLVLLATHVRFLADSSRVLTDHRTEERDGAVSIAINEDLLRDSVSSSQILMEIRVLLEREGQSIRSDTFEHVVRIMTPSRDAYLRQLARARSGADEFEFALALAEVYSQAGVLIPRRVMEDLLYGHAE